MPCQSKPEIAYIMKGFPRVSEVFISNEISLLERLGLSLRIFAIKGLSEKKVHGVVENIRAEVTYLPEDASVEDSKFSVWLRANLPQFIGSHVKLFVKRPLTYMCTLWQAFRFSLKYRSSFFPTFKKAFFKDFLRAGYIALKVVESGRIGHLHGHFCHGSTTITLFVSQLTGVPFSFTAHAKDIYLPKLNPGDLLQTKIRKAQFVATCTDANRVHLQSLCTEVPSIHTIYHGLDTTLFTPAEPQDEEQKIPTILAVGRFVEKKGFPYLIQACHLLKQQGYAFRCRMVGEADEQTELIKQLIKELQLDETVSLHGAVTQEQLRQIYRECAIFALPCRIVNNGDRDGIPNVLVEAMAMEIPVVSTTVSGIPELIEHQVDGLLIPPQDVAALATALETLLRDPALRTQLGKNARDKVCRRFDSMKTTVALKSLFESCLDTNGRVTS
jgi:glycosyltransferase involved in cell wall biosynthesis